MDPNKQDDTQPNQVPQGAPQNTQPVHDPQGTGNSDKRYIDVTDDVRRAVEEAQLLVSYVAHNGVIAVDQAALEVIIKSKYLIVENKWTPEAEVLFWTKYDDITAQIKPVTIESLRSIAPHYELKKEGDFKRKPSRAAKAMRLYSIFTIITIFFIVLFQIYTIIGMDLRRNLQDVFEERNTAASELYQMNYLGNTTSDSAYFQTPDYRKQRDKLDLLNQNLDANYELLQSWNRLWQSVLFAGPFEGKVTRHVQQKYDTLISEIEMDLNATLDAGDANIIRNHKKALNETQLALSLDKARNRLFLNELSAGFLLNALQIYILPLLYGLLGALAFILRTLSQEIRKLIYVGGVRTRYLLRIILGGLGGLAIGWFLQPDQITFINNISPMAIAFVAGYNVDVLFTIMDKLIASIKRWANKGGEEGENPIDQEQNIVNPTKRD